MQDVFINYLGKRDRERPFTFTLTGSSPSAQLTANAP